MDRLIKSTFPCFLLLICFSCKTLNKVVPASLEEQAIKEVLFAQQKAWNKGDIEAYMKGYIPNETLSFVGSKGVTYGWVNTLNNYKKSYPDKATMGTLKFDVLELNRLSASYYHMIGKYTLIRAADQPSGYFTLIWKKIDGKWLVISDHTSG